MKNEIKKIHALLFENDKRAQSKLLKKTKKRNNNFERLEK